MKVGSVRSISTSLVRWIVKGLARDLRRHPRALIVDGHFELDRLTQARIFSLYRGQAQVGFQKR